MFIIILLGWFCRWGNKGIEVSGLFIDLDLYDCKIFFFSYIIKFIDFGRYFWNI